MQDVPFKDPEKQDFSKVFVLLGVGLLLALGWEVYDELIGRQPWKAYQEEFKRLELSQAEKQLAEARARFEEKQKKLAGAPPHAQPTSMVNYRKRLAEAEQILKSPIYSNALSEIERLKQGLDELDTQRRFIKADLDAAYYELDTLVEQSGHSGSGVKGVAHSGDTASPALKEAQNKAAALAAKLAANRNEQATRQMKLAATTAKVALFEEDLRTIKAQMDEETRSVVAIEERIAKLQARPPTIQQIVVSGLGEFQAVNRCTTCHMGIDRAEFARAEKLVFRAHPNREVIFKHHPVEKMGCTVCHDGQGRALNVKEAHEGDEHWHAPLLAGHSVEASCVKCHANAPLLPEASMVAQGAQLFQTHGCIACHKVDGSPYLTAAVGRLGPELGKIKGKLRPGWLVTWIQDPKHVHPRTLMPEFGVKGKGMEEQEARAIAGYLIASSDSFLPSIGALKYASEHKPDATTLATGKQLFQERGCLGCHDLGERRATGPRHVALDGIGGKAPPAWIYTWIEDPKQISATSVMPKFSLSAREVACLTDYLSSLKEPTVRVAFSHASESELLSNGNYDRGRKLIKKYGCYGCHAIPGLENIAEKIGPELTDFAAKDPHLLFWGTKNVVPARERNWYTWTKARLNEPKVFETDRIEAIMPNFHLTGAETEKIVMFLKTLSTQQTMAKEHRRELKAGERELIAGQQLLSHYGCTGCHSLYDGKQTRLAGGFQSQPVAHFGTIAPNLTPEGDRVRAEWLADFLKAPVKMRPYLTAMMPTFNLQGGDYRALFSYFRASAQGAEHLGRKESPDESPVSDPQAGQELLASYQCVSCHQVGGREVKPASELAWYKNMDEARKFAPDLVHSAQKLDPIWANRWMENPHALMPDTTMPYVGLTREEVSKIRSYLAGLTPQSTARAVK